VIICSHSGLRFFQLPLFTEITERYTEARLFPEKDFTFNLADLEIPNNTTLAIIVNSNGSIFTMVPLPALLQRHPDTHLI
jgi:histidinol-phosphate aminotransferase